MEPVAGWREQALLEKAHSLKNQRQGRIDSSGAEQYAVPQAWYQLIAQCHGMHVKETKPPAAFWSPRPSKLLTVSLLSASFLICFFMGIS